MILNKYCRIDAVNNRLRAQGSIKLLVQKSDRFQGAKGLNIGVKWIKSLTPRLYHIFLLNKRVGANITSKKPFQNFSRHFLRSSKFVWINYGPNILRLIKAAEKTGKNMHIFACYMRYPKIKCFSQDISEMLQILTLAIATKIRMNSRSAVVKT